jgi:hypothetical protein
MTLVSRRIIWCQRGIMGRFGCIHNFSISWTLTKSQQSRFFTACSIHQHLNTRTYLQMMEYERCVRKKLRSLFEYLDTDKDGRITPSCLQSGLIRLQNYSTGVGVCTPNPAAPQICEYEIEELLRAVPR